MILLPVIVDKLINWTGTPSHTFKVLYWATGNGCAAILFITVSIHPVFVVVIKETEYVPVAAYTCFAFKALDWRPSPNNHKWLTKEYGAITKEVLVKEVVSPIQASLYV